MIHVDLFTGLGGGILAGQLLGWRTIAACEIDSWCRELLIRRQNDATLSPFPIWDNVRTFPGRDFQGRVDVVSGGFPCQDISLAGHKRERAQRELFERGKHIEADRSGLWSEMRRIIEEIRPTFAFIENVPALRSRGFDRVLQDLSALGFDAAWDCLRASDFGAPHKRDRIWILAANSERESLRNFPERKASKRDKISRKRKAVLGHFGEAGSNQTVSFTGSGFWLETKPPLFGVDDEPPGRLDQLRAIGNAQVPIVAAIAFESLLDRLIDQKGH